MKKVYSLLTMAVIAAMSLTLTSCDGDDYWYDPYGWYDHYDDWGWNNDDWNQGQQGSQDNTLLAMAQTLTGEWEGTMKDSWLNDEGTQRNTDEFDVNMKFFQYSNSSDALSGEGVETDIRKNDDGSIADQRSLNFQWYIADNGNIYIKYKGTGATFVMDYGSSQVGFHLGEEQGYNVDTFWGYMIGTGNVNGEVIYIDLQRVNNTNANNAKANGPSRVMKKSLSSFGKGATLTPLKATSYQLNNRR